MLFYWLLFALLFTACWSDIRQRVIANWIALSVFTLGLVRLCITLEVSIVQWSALTFYSLLIVALCLLFYYRCLGGGDIKLLIGLIPWFSVELYMYFVVLCTLLGGMLAVLMSFSQLVSNIIKSSLCEKTVVDKLINLRQLSVPYALPISIAALFLLSKEFLG